MAYEQNTSSFSAVAAGSIYPNRICKFDSNGEILQAGANDLPCGIAPDATHDRDTAYAADDNDHIAVKNFGIAKVTAGTTVTPGQWLKSDSTGRAVPITATKAAGPQNCIGQARSGGAVNNVIMVMIDICVRTSTT